jgi:hypothetical protein
MLKEWRPAVISKGTVQVHDPLLGAFAKACQWRIVREAARHTKNVSSYIYDIGIWIGFEIAIKNDINSLRRLASCPREREWLSWNGSRRSHAHGKII